MKFIYFTDPHFTNIAPRFRIDDFADTCIKKACLLRDLAEEHNAYLLCGGDLFNSFRTNLQFADLIIEALGPNLICNIGNHDLDKNSASSMQRTLIKHYTRMSKIRSSTNGFLLLSDIGNTPIEIHFKPFDFDEEFADYIPTKESDPNNYRILLTHSMFTTAYCPFKYRLVSEFDSGGMDLVLLGHYHPEIKMSKTKDGVPAVSPGALTRLTLYGDDLMREPKILLIDTIKASIKPIKLNVPASEKVFDMTKVKEAKKVSEEDITAYMTLTQDRIKRINTRDLIQEIWDKLEGEKNPDILAFLMANLETIESGAKDD